jgi:uncharacterized protein
MKKLLLCTILAALGMKAMSQASTNTLLWKVSGKNLKKPTYLFGTIHMICADDIQLSDSLKNAIKSADRVYLELDLNNLFEMMGAMAHMQMRNDTTLADLLPKDDYERVKEYFTQHSGMIPFNMLETYKPLLAESMIMEQESANCDNLVAMEQLIMQEAKSSSVELKGLETMNYQLSIFDSIPYKYQAQQLAAMVKSGSKKTNEAEMKELADAYKSQQLDKMAALTTKDDAGMERFADLLLYNRNRNWVKKLNDLMPQYSLLVAVGAGHLPGEGGVINLLRKQGYKVEPVKNEMVKKKTREI